jgi:hypothetical protein
MAFHSYVDATCKQKSLWECALHVVEEIITMQVGESDLTSNVGSSIYYI